MSALTSIILPLSPVRAARLLARLVKALGEQPRVPSGTPEGGQFASKDGHDLTVQRAAGIAAVDKLLTQAVEEADYQSSGTPDSWDDVNPDVQNEVEQEWLQNYYENSDIDTSYLDEKTIKDLRNDNEEIIADALVPFETSIRDAFPNVDQPTIPLDGEPFSPYHLLDMDTFTVGEDEGEGSPVELGDLRFIDGSPLTGVEQQRVSELWASHYDETFGHAREKAFESDSYNEERSDLESQQAGEEWNNLGDSQKLDLVSDNSSHTISGGRPRVWMTGVVERTDVDNRSDDYIRTRAIANKLAELRTDEIMKERGIEHTASSVDEQSDTQTFIKDTWESWKNSSSNDRSLALQIAMTKELGGIHRISPEEVKRITEDTGEDEMNVLQAYARAQWETTQFIMGKAGEDKVEVFRGLMLPATDVNETKNLAVEGYTKLPSLNLQRAGAQSTTGTKSVANGWNGVGKLPPNPTRVVLRIQAPSTSVFSLPVYGENSQEEHEVVLAGTKDRWLWDAWRGKAPNFTVHPVTNVYDSLGYLRTAANVLTIDLQAEDANRPHWLSSFRAAGGPGSGRYPKGSGGHSDGTSVKLYRGDSKSLNPSLSYSDPGALFGAGIYLTDSKRIAGDYKSKGAGDGVLFSVGGGTKTTKDDAIEMYIRREARYFDKNGNRLRYEQPLHGYVGKFESKELNAKVREDEQRIQFATDHWNAIKDGIEVRKQADNKIIFREKTAPGHLSEYHIPTEWTKHTLNAENEIPEAVADGLYDVLRGLDDRQTANDMHNAAMREDEDGFRPTYRDIFTSLTGGPLRDTEEGSIALRQMLKGLGYKGIEYNGGQTMGGARHTAYVFWDEQGLKKVRALEFDESQPRDDHGRWVDQGGGVSHWSGEGSAPDDPRTFTDEQGYAWHEQGTVADWARALPYADHQVLGSYSSFGYSDVNSYLRGSFEPREGRETETVKTLAQKLDTSIAERGYELPEPITVGRAAYLPGVSFEDLEAHVGKIFVEPGFTSTMVGDAQGRLTSYVASGKFESIYKRGGGKSDSLVKGQDEVGAAMRIKIQLPAGTKVASIEASRRLEHEFPRIQDPEVFNHPEWTADGELKPTDFTIRDYTAKPMVKDANLSDKQTRSESEVLIGSGARYRIVSVKRGPNYEGSDDSLKPVPIIDVLMEYVGGGSSEGKRGRS